MLHLSSYVSDRLRLSNCASGPFDVGRVSWLGLTSLWEMQAANFPWHLKVTTLCTDAAIAACQLTCITSTRISHRPDGHQTLLCLHFTKHLLHIESSILTSLAVILRFVFRSRTASATIDSHLQAAILIVRLPLEFVSLTNHCFCVATTSSRESHLLPCPDVWTWKVRINWPSLPRSAASAFANPLCTCFRHWRNTSRT